MIKTILPLSMIIGLRFFGLFIVLPVLSVYALSLKGADEFLVGIVVGGYALTQMIFQVPFGLMSDKIGRKKTLFVGLVIFAIGSVVCALSDDVYSLMIGRFLQGAGAIGAVVSAMISDLVKEEQRAHAMAVMGGTIAMSFVVAMIVGPLVGGYYGIDKLFWITGALTIMAMVVLFTRVPNPPTIEHAFAEEKAKVRDVFQDDSLKRMYITFLFHSSIMTMAFLIIPIVMTTEFGWEKIDLWEVYLPALIMGVIAMGPAAVFGEKYGKGKQIFMISVGFIALGFILMGFASEPFYFIAGVTSFFIGFNMFEPLLQSFVAKFAKVHQKGAALGVANSFAYAGIFMGGIVGGYLLKEYDRSVIAYLVLGLSAVWIWWISTMKNPAARANVYLPFSEYDKSKLEDIRCVDGIHEYYTNITEEIIVIKYEKDIIDEEAVKSLLK